MSPPPTTRGGGHIVFSADPVVVGALVCVFVFVASCLHSIAFMNGWILAKLIQIYQWMREKCWLILVTLTPFSRSLEVLDRCRTAENCLSLPYLLKEWTDFDQTCTSISFGHVKELIRFWGHWPYFQGHMWAYIFGKWFVCTLSLE